MRFQIWLLFPPNKCSCILSDRCNIAEWQSYNTQSLVQGDDNFVGAARGMELKKPPCPDKCRPDNHSDWELCWEPFWLEIVLSAEPNVLLSDLVHFMDFMWFYLIDIKTAFCSLQGMFPLKIHKLSTKIQKIIQ